MVAKNQAPVSGRALLFESEFAGNDFLKSNVCERRPRAGLDHWPMPQTKLTHALGYNVNEQLRVGNDLAGFLQELSRHNAQGVDGARVGSAGNWRIVGEQDEMGPGKDESRASRQKRNRECAKLSTHLSKDFCRPAAPARSSEYLLRNWRFCNRPARLRCPRRGHNEATCFHYLDTIWPHNRAGHIGIARGPRN